MKVQLLAILLVLFVGRAVDALSCGDCNHDNTTESCGPPPSCEETVLDACGCCPLCAKLVGETCAGPWNSLGSCAKGLVCRPTATDTPVLGAGGYFSETWDPAGICVDQYEYQQNHSQCLKLMKEYQNFLLSRNRRDADDVNPVLSSENDGDVTDRTVPMETTTIGCVRKPSCTPNGSFAPLQCDGCAGECWCSFHDGEEIHGTRGPYRNVRC